MTKELAIGNYDIADMFFDRYCSWMGIGDSIMGTWIATFYRAVANQITKISGVGSVGLDEVMYGPSSINWALHTMTQYDPIFGPATQATEPYSVAVGRPEFRFTAGTVHDNWTIGTYHPDQSNGRVVMCSLSRFSQWRLTNPSAVDLMSKAGKWRLVYFQTPNGPQNLKAWECKPRTDYHTITGQIEEYANLNFRGANEVKYMEFPGAAVTANFSETAYRRLNFYGPGGTYPSNDLWCPMEAEWAVDRTGNIAHWCPAGGSSLARDWMGLTSPEYPAGAPYGCGYPTHWINYLKALDINLLVIALGQNGWNQSNQNPTTFPQNLRKFMDTSKQANPNMKFLLLGYPRFSSGDLSTANARVNAINQAILDAAREDTLFLNIAEIYGNEYYATSLTSDTVHPSSLANSPAGSGAYEYGRSVASALFYARSRTTSAVDPRKSNVVVTGLKPDTNYLFEKVFPPVRSGEVAMVPVRTDNSGNVPETSLTRNAKYAIRERGKRATRILDTGTTGRLVM